MGTQRTHPAPSPHPSTRRTRGDGNCFFRSFLFGYVEHLLLGGDAAEAARVLARVEGMKAALAGVGGYQEIGTSRRGRRVGVPWCRVCVCEGACSMHCPALLAGRRGGGPPAIKLPVSIQPAHRPPLPHHHHPAVLETPLEMVLSMLRSVGAPVDPLTIEGLETTVRDEELRWG